MNIFYIGPLQQQSFLGQFSSALVKEISSIKENNIYVYPIYGGNNTVNHTDIFETNAYPDINIQHCTITDVHPDLNSKTYFIPIMSSIQSIPSEFHNKIQLIDKILPTNTHDYHTLINAGVDKKKIEQLSLVNCDTPQDEISLPLFANCKKYYTLVESENIATLKVIMSNFLQTYTNNDNACLICYCEFDDPKDQSDIINFYKEAKSYHNANIYTDKIFFMFNKDDKIKQAIHKTGDVFLALNENYFPFLNASIAKSYNNKIITYSDLDLDTNNNGNVITYTIINKSLQQALKDDKATPTDTNEVDIKKLLC